MQLPRVACMKGQVLTFPIQLHCLISSRYRLPNVDRRRPDTLTNSGNFDYAQTRRFLFETPLPPVLLPLSSLPPPAASPDASTTSTSQTCVAAISVFKLNGFFLASSSRPFPVHPHIPSTLEISSPPPPRLAPECIAFLLPLPLRLANDALPALRLPPNSIHWHAAVPSFPLSPSRSPRFVFQSNPQPCRPTLRPPFLIFQTPRCRQ
ncbi:hypothetical protein R3P38DRAFT_3228283 [Favolaschia claudopus]|uniref:Uncharacterized protein n=1 Tax=Favolaschia claudopus TaxID=2862362 RepID=A0AAV9ZQP6_9AGAR